MRLRQVATAVKLQVQLARIARLAREQRVLLRRVFGVAEKRAGHLEKSARRYPDYWIVVFGHFGGMNAHSIRGLGNVKKLE